MIRFKRFLQTSILVLGLIALLPLVGIAMLCMWIFDDGDDDYYGRYW